MSRIYNQAEFNSRVKDVNTDQLLIFHGTDSDASRVNGYRIVARRAAKKSGQPLEIHTINVDNCQLDAEDKSQYMVGDYVICCTTINDGVVMDKAVNPMEYTLYHMLISIMTPEGGYYSES